MYSKKYFHYYSLARYNTLWFLNICSLISTQSSHFDDCFPLVALTFSIFAAITYLWIMQVNVFHIWFYFCKLFLNPLFIFNIKQPFYQRLFLDFSLKFVFSLAIFSVRALFLEWTSPLVIQKKWFFKLLVIKIDSSK